MDKSSQDICSPFGSSQIEALTGVISFPQLIIRGQLSSIYQFQPDDNAWKTQKENKHKQKHNKKESNLGQQPIIQDKCICIEPVCFEDDRIIDASLTHDQHHKKTTLKALAKQLQMLKCNYHFKQAQESKTAHLMQNLNQIYNQIVQFQQELNQLFTKLKLTVYNHITQVQLSFSNQYYQRIRTQLIQDFTYTNVAFALSEIQKYKVYSYPNLDYPSFKINMLRTKLSEISLSNKAITVQAVKLWGERLMALDKNDRRKMISRSAGSFMAKNPCQKKIFSYYLKSQEYCIGENGKRLQRIDNEDDNPLAVVEKELISQTEIRFKINRLGRGVMIGFGSLNELQNNNFSTSLDKLTTGYFLSHRGGESLIPRQKCNRLKCQIFSFGQGDILSLKRENNRIFFSKKKGDKFQGFKIQLKQQQRDLHLYPCVFLQNKQAIVSIID